MKKLNWWDTQAHSGYEANGPGYEASVEESDEETDETEANAPKVSEQGG